MDSSGRRLFEPYFLLAEQFRPVCSMVRVWRCRSVSVMVRVMVFLTLGDQSQHQKLVLGGGDVIARYRGRLTRRAGTADIAGTVGVAGGGLTVCGGRLIAGDGVGRVIRVPLSGNGVAGRRDYGRQWTRGNPHDSMGKRLVNYVTYIMPQVLENTGRNAGRILKLGGSPSGPVL